MNTPTHCPGFETFKKLDSFTVKCPKCKKENEIFSDEFNKQRKCNGCGDYIDFTKVVLK